ncbi:alkaline phosphatase family protein [Oligoflexus tunisiensis]|uniref:alkaline phosphatase family protein n=1 Tax=Oligoflexus tunisiensis TaxID=708132 RepID=UPI00114CC5EA|nr:alkaline phosphatase family protein [Oligoflexus tunisiensis]
MIRLIPLFLLSLICLALTANPAWAQLARLKKPKLILTLVVDQFRVDQLARFHSRLLPAQGARGEAGGFRYLTERGAYYPFAEFGLLQNMTCPGHATILTGAHAYQHGIPINIWYDAASGKKIYCVEDPASLQVGVADPSQVRGVSPRNLRGSTLGDELKNSGYPTRVVTIALKDRSAILLGGARADLALWFDRDGQHWVSSRYYLPQGELPTWVQELNASLRKNQKDQLHWAKPAGAGSGTSWTSNEHVTLSKTTEAMGRDFPHRTSGRHAQAVNYPEGTVWTVDAAVKALQSLKLGRGQATDLLAVSFSSHDGLSHSYGPNSRQLEELMLVEDREIARLLQAVQKTVGLDETVIVLTGDHGGMPSAEWLRAQKMDAGRVDEAGLQQQAEAFLVKTFGAAQDGSWLAYSSNFNFFLNPAVLRQHKLERDAVLQRLKKFFQEEANGREAILHVITAEDVRQNTLPPGLLQKLITQTYTAGRSGDVLMILKPHYVMPGSTAEHMSAYSYDRMVPLVIAGPQVKPGVYGQKAEIIDIAPTLAFFAGTTPPSGSEGRVLHEILRSEVRK